MLIFNCTKAAAAFFTSTRKGKKISPMSSTPKIGLSEETTLHDHQHWHWMVHTTKVGQRNVLLAIDTDSRFCMIFWGLKKGDTQDFIEQFHDRFNLHIMDAFNMGDLDETIFHSSIDTFMENHHEHAFIQRGCRSVQGHINDVFMNLIYERRLWNDKVPTEEELFITDWRHNDTPRKRKQDKDYLYPTQKLFRTWLSSYAHLDEQTIEQTINLYREQNRPLWNFPFDPDIDDLYIDEILRELAETLDII